MSFTMKKFITALLVVASIGVASVPSSAQASTRTELLQQIEQLMTLISSLQAQLGSSKQPTAKGGKDMQLYLKNLSRSDRVFKNKEITASTGERVGVGWNNKGLKDCTLKNTDKELRAIENGGTSEIASGIQVVLPQEGRSAHTYVITVECTLKGKTITDKVLIKYSDPFYDLDQKFQNSLLRETPNVKGTLSIKQLNATQMQLAGTITPHTGCVGRENMEVILDYGNDKSKTFTLKDCMPVSYKEMVIYTPSMIPVFPSLVLRWVDANTNVWQNNVLASYKLDVLNPLKPTIINLGVGGEKG